MAAMTKQQRLEMAIRESVGETIPRAVLIDVLWPTHPPADVGVSLKTAMRAVRKRVPHLEIRPIRGVGYLIERQQIEAEES